MALRRERPFFRQILDEFERREQNRRKCRELRDLSDPFSTPEEQFRKMYRLSREAAMDLFLELENHFEGFRRNTKIPSVVKFIMALHFFAHGSYQKSVGKDEHCRLSQAAVSRSLHEVVDIMIEHLGDQFIKFPTTMEEINGTKLGFYQKFGFPGLVGCVDGTHIRIFPPPAHHQLHPGHLFINRKHVHTLNCQIICDSDLKILSINARYPGSIHDAAIWMTSEIRHFLMEEYYQNGNRTTWLLGDSGYPTEPFLLTPVIGAAPNTPQGRYNQAHKTTRNCVERCIGNLKAYWRCVLQHRVLHYKPVFAAKIIYCCCILHNILKMRNIVDEDIVIVLDEPIDDDERLPEGDNNLLQEGRAVRDNVIMQNFN